MKRLLLSSVVALSLSGCLMPSKINPTLGCGPLGCTSKDYYLPGKGVWAPRDQLSFSKAKIGAISGVIAGSKHHRYPGQDYHVRQHTRNHYHRHYCNCGVKTIRIEERYWVPERIIRDSCGNVLYYEPGRYETSYKFRSVPACR